MVQNPAEIAHGPMFIGLLFNTCLYGVTITQCYLYWVTCQRDPAWIKRFVFVLFLADTANSLFDAMALYGTLVKHFGDLQFLGTCNWLYSSDPATTAIIAFLVQGFYAWRVKALTSNVWFASVISICAVLGLAAGLVTAVLSSTTITLFSEFYKLRTPVIVWLASNVAGDIIITSVLVFYLAKYRTGIVVTDNLINGIIKVTVQTGMVTAICATINLITYLTVPTGIYLTFNYTLAKLYANSMMSTLNSRVMWQAKHADVPIQLTDTRSTDIMSRKSVNTKANTPGMRGRPEVFVHVEQHVEQHEMRNWDNSSDPNAGVLDVKRDVRLQFGSSHSDSDTRETDCEKPGSVA